MEVNEHIIATGKIFELVQLPQSDGRVFEVARRAPGVRVIVADVQNRRVLLTKEFRRELNDWDYRLPGGKVFDTLGEYEAHRTSSDDIVVAAEKKASEELAEEAGVVAKSLQFYRKSTLGTTVEWDLHVFVSTDWSLAEFGQQLGAEEDIDANGWFSYDEAEVMIMRGEMREERIALVLLLWLHEQKVQA
jgi:8-oxo-dGTP pyrophosphatase MutT (NUDIX family)